MSSEPKPADVGTSVAKAGGIMVISLFLSRVLGMVREMVMTGKFGSGSQTDAYNLAFSLPDLLFFLIAGGALSSAFIPVFTEYYQTEREDEAWHVFSVVATVMSIVVLTFITIAWILAEPITHLLAPSATGQKFNDIVLMSRIVLPTQYAFFIGGLMFGTLYARRVFAIPGLGPNVYNIGILFGALVLSSFTDPPIAGMSWGALGGAMIGNLIIPFLTMRKLGSKFSFSLDVRHPGVVKVFKLMLPVVLGLSLPGVYDLISRYYGQMYSDGLVTNLKLGNVLMQAPLAVFGQSLALAAFPVLSQHFARGETGLYQSQMNATIRQVLFISIPISALMFAAPEPIVVAIFQHGAFTVESSRIVSDLLRLLSLGIWAWCLHPVLMRGFFAAQHSTTPIVIGTITTGVFFLLINLGRQTSLSYLAIPVASSLSGLFLVAALLIALHRRMGGVDFPGIFATMGKALLGSIVFVGVTYGLLQVPYLQSIQTNKLGAVLILLLVCLPGFSLYVVIARALKMPETAALDRTFDKIRSRVGR